MELPEKEVSNLGIIEQGTCGTCVWELDDEKTLTIRPQDGENGVMATDEHGVWPWKTNCHVKNVVLTSSHV